MKILVIGQGGREHVLAWKASQSPKVSEIYCAPGNTGMASLGTCVDIKVSDIEGLVNFAKEKQIDLTLVGPEAPLVDGVVDEFKKEGLKVFGPDKYASQLEGSKAFAKDIMKKAGVPTASYEEFTDEEKALNYLSNCNLPIVVKADGLAAGKGVTIATTKAEAENAIKQAIGEGIFGEAGKKILIEEFLDGEEASLIAVSDGKTILNLASSQDHKRIFDGDEGPNTGGMGAYSPAPVVTKEIENQAIKNVFQPVIDELSKQGHPFVGFLYAGIMVTQNGIKVLEFNVRFGDPEAQVVLYRLESDFIEMAECCVNGTLSNYSPKWNEGSAVTVVLASEGYPGSYKKGDVINGIEDVISLDNSFVFHAGTKEESGKICTNGGRVLNIVSSGKDIQEAVSNVYLAVDKVKFDGMQYRKDIAHRALGRAATEKSEISN